MRWLIVEDALKDRTGHWLEWVTTFDQGLRELGDEVKVLADSEVMPEIRESLRAEAILPPSIWHQLGDGAGPLKRYLRIFTHNWRTYRVMGRFLDRNHQLDAIFVPTVSVHHLFAWALLVKRHLRRRDTRVLLFFLTAPVQLNSAGEAVSDRSPTARLLTVLLKWLGPEIRAGKVVPSVETKAMQAAFQTLTGLPFVWLPQPVPAKVRTGRAGGPWIEMACFGAARAEKGSDVLQEAIRLHRRRHPSSRARFTFQWINDFEAGGRLITKSAELQGDPQVSILTRYFGAGEYAGYLQGTDVMLLPYRYSSYAFRGSRVVLEAAVNGIPVVTTRGTTLASVADELGIGIGCDDGDAESLAGAIAEMEARFETMLHQASEASAAAAEMFSVREFRQLFLAAARPTATKAAGLDATGPCPVG